MGRWIIAATEPDAAMNLSRAVRGEVTAVSPRRVMNSRLNAAIYSRIVSNVAPLRKPTTGIAGCWRAPQAATPPRRRAVGMKLAPSQLDLPRRAVRRANVGGTVSRASRRSGGADRLLHFVDCATAVGGLRALENAACVDAGLTYRIPQARPVASSAGQLRQSHAPEILRESELSDGQTWDIPGSDAIHLRVMWP